MKNFYLFFVLFLTACQSDTFTYVSENIGVNLSGQKVAVLEKSGKVVYTKQANWLKKILNNNGMEATLSSEALSNKKKNIPLPKYVATVDTIQLHKQDMQSVPVWGPTSIQSVNTYSSGYAQTNAFGSYNSNTNYGLNGSNTSGMFNVLGNTNYSGVTNTSFNYNYGITGYNNVVVDRYMSCVLITVKEANFKIKEFDDLKSVHDSKICINKFADDDILMIVANDILTQTNLLTDDSAFYKCRDGNEPHLCVRE